MNDRCSECGSRIGPVGAGGAPAVPSEAVIQKVSAAERLREVLEKIAAYGLPDDAIAPERDDFSTPEDRTIHAWVRQAREALAEGSLAPAPSGPHDAALEAIQQIADYGWAYDGKVSFTINCVDIPSARRLRDLIGATDRKAE